MSHEQVMQASQQQATAAWVDFLNISRANELIENLARQDTNLENALAELQKLKDFLSSPEHILGSSATKHGEIAENMQVYISNAKRFVQGFESQYTFDGVGRTAPEDYLFDGNPVQQKFYNGARQTVDAVKKHLEKYPDFLKNGGTYDIPKDQYEYIVELLNKPSSELSRSEATLVKIIHEWEKKNGISFTDKVNSAIINYPDAQAGKADATVKDAETAVKEKDKEKRNETKANSEPSLKEGAVVTAIAAAIEGGLQFSLAVYKKLKSGKKLAEFTKEDWIDIGKSTTVGAGTGAVRGSGTYILTNFANMPASTANGYITSLIGITSQTIKFRKGEIDEEEFLINTQVVCLDAAVSVVGAAIGQAIIPVPILGAVIGSSVANFLTGLTKDNSSKKEQELIDKYKKDLDALNAQLSAEEMIFVQLVNNIYNKFNSLLELAFDEDINIAFDGSIQLSTFVGVKPEKILKTKQDIDNYFLQ